MFRRNLRDNVERWRLRIGQGSPPLGQLELSREIGREAGQLGSIARAHGFLGIAQHLQQIERVAAESPGSLVEIVSLLLRSLDWDEENPDPPRVRAPNATVAMATAPRDVADRPALGSTPLPPLLDGSDGPLPRVQAVVPGERMGGRASEPSEPPRPPSSPPEVQARPSSLPDPVAAPAAAPKFLFRNMLRLQTSWNQGPPGPGERARENGLGRGGPANQWIPEGQRAPSQPPRLSPVPAPPRRRSSPPSPSPSPQRAAPLPRRVSRAPRAAVPSWVFALGAGVGLAALAIVVVLVWTRTDPLPPLRAVASDAHGTLAASKDASALEARDPAVQVVHQQGQETAELHALIEQQSRLIAACRADPTKCNKWARNAVDLPRFDPATFVPSPDGAQPLAAWLQRLKLPVDFPARDDPAVRAFFGYSAKHPTGHASMQLKIFSCAKYDDIFDMTLVKYGAPSWLKAIVYQESACNPLAGSHAGARGLWQFMAESARAYGLLVNEKGDVDERLSAVKSTEAAIHFLTDLHAKLHAWDLALAAYNMGPYGLAYRIAQVGGNAGFWDLRRGDLLPKETADYVPAIEAYAIILENGPQLGFPRDRPAPESLTELNVKPGTRLSLIARVVRTSTTKIKEYNLDFLGDIVPAGETAVRVPLSVDQALKAQQELDNWPAGDARDICAPPDYVWGSSDFETSNYAKKCDPPASGR